MQTTPRKARALALLTGAALITTAVFQPTPAQAADKKAYKYGAIGLAALGAYLIVKGKTVPGAIAAGGAYYAYKKSQKADDNDNRYGYNQYPTDPRYRDNTYSNNGYNYPNNGNYNNGYNTGYNNGYSNYPNNGGYNNGYYSNNGNYNGNYQNYPNSNGTYYRVQPNR